MYFSFSPSKCSNTSLPILAFKMGWFKQTVENTQTNFGIRNLNLLHLSILHLYYLFGSVVNNLFSTLYLKFLLGDWCTIGCQQKTIFCTVVLFKPRLSGAWRGADTANQHLICFFIATFLVPCDSISSLGLAFQESTLIVFVIILFSLLTT